MFGDGYWMSALFRYIVKISAWNELNKNNFKITDWNGSARRVSFTASSRYSKMDWNFASQIFTSLNYCLYSYSLNRPSNAILYFWTVFQLPFLFGFQIRLRFLVLKWVGARPIQSVNWKGYCLCLPTENQCFTITIFQHCSDVILGPSFTLLLFQSSLATIWKVA